MPIPSPHPTILLFETDPDIYELTSMLLQQQGYGVLPAGSFDEAERLVEAGGIDVMLADSGQLTLDRAREQYRRYGSRLCLKLPVIVFTAHNLGTDEMRELGYADVVNKPFDIDELMRVVDRHVPGPC